MSQSKPKVILTRKLLETIETRMRELFDTTLNDSDKALSRDELEIAVKTADVLVPTVTDKVDADLITKAGSQLRLIASFGTGVDHIDANDLALTGGNLDPAAFGRVPAQALDRVGWALQDLHCAASTDTASRLMVERMPSPYVSAIAVSR